MDTKPLNFKSMAKESHKNAYFSRYIRIICDIFDVDFIIAYELYEERYGLIKTPYDLGINSEVNVEIKVQNQLVLEQYTDDDKKTLGWVDTILEDNVDYVLFFFPKKNEYLCLHGWKLFDWWKENKDKYKIIRNDPSNRAGNIWVSSFSFVDIFDIPRDLIYKTNIDLVCGVNHWL